MTTVIIVLGFLLYIFFYFTYGKKLEREVVKATDETEAPSKRIYDGVDFIPARREVLFGHHFASIAGAAPIIGPALAICWGWVPGLLWVWFGNIFIGAVHDYLALMASTRYDGKSIQFVASDLLGKKTGRGFYWLVFFLLILVVAAFAAIVGGMFVKTPEIASTYVLKIVAALILGVLMYRIRMNFLLATVVGIAMLIAAIWLGSLQGIALSYTSWMWIFFFYIIIAASIPVNILLQPRDYLNSWLLYAGLALGFLGAVFAFKGFEVPAFSSFSPVLLGGKPTPFWPAIPLVIACGSLSGFHSLVASGTTSKQLAKESDALFIGYGAMFTEGFLSTIVIVAIAGFGYTALKNAGVDAETLNADNWGAMFTKASASVGLSKANLFVQSYADMVNATWLAFLPTKIVKIVAGMWVASFAMTTLDTTNRLARYCLSEMALPLKDKAEGLYSLLTNPWVASVIPAAIGIWLAASGNWLVIWGSFGAANQLIASIALMAGAAYVAKKLKSNFANSAVIPAWILWVTVTAAIVWFVIMVQPGAIANKPLTGWTVMVILCIMLVLNLMFIWDFVKSKAYKVSED
ncbi:carbon starvation CstA family protein [Desulfovermiculus halophilus]|jgi:carbon starvation protein|uniref:carbon starvation CstA family protein n=1 Tax=Desulfovermiculus halophilus TaxID=339722 RepID=UPI0004870E8F|nr:carbon starvation protein A [Desulfovermiculus halophilus]